MAALIVLLLVPAAEASVPSLLAQVPEDGLSGSGAGQMFVPRGIAADPSLPGHVYVVDGENMRIDEFTTWGEFVRAWGWGVKDGEAEFEVCTEASGCEKGIEGAGAGQFRSPEAITVDAHHHVYVIEAENHRVQKFDSEGNFLLAFGWGVRDGTAEAQTCGPEATPPSATCQVGIAGIGADQFGGSANTYTNRITTSPLDDTVFVGEGERVQAFNPDGTLKELIAGGDLAGKTLRALAAGSDGNLYVGFVGQATVRKLAGSGPSGEFLTPEFKAPLEAERPFGLALDGAGNLYAAAEGGGEPRRILQFDETGKCLNCGAEGEGGSAGFDRTPGSELRSIATGAACGSSDAYVAHFKASPPPEQSFFRIYGDPPDGTLCPPPAAAPEVSSQYALSVGTSSAELHAEINPQYWPDTTYYLQYGTSPCFEGDCAAKPSPPGALLTAKTIKAPLKSAPITLEGLTPGTTYHYRFVAQSGGGGPVFGLAGKSGAEAEGTFTTFRRPVAESCPANEAFRGGFAAFLPDCRAYEMVSPLEKNNADISVLPEGTTQRPATLDQSSLDGNRVSYGSATPFGDAPSGAFTSQYIAARGKAEWRTHAITPPRGSLNLTFSQGPIDTELKALSPDLCDSWWRTVAEPPLSPAAVPGFANLYRRGEGECGTSGFEALTTAEPPDISGEKSFPLELQGLSADGSRAIYAINDSLPGSGAPPEPGECVSEEHGCLLRLYYQEPGESAPHYVCVLPDGSAVSAGCSAGTNNHDNGRFRSSTYQGAISTDGSRVFWSTYPGTFADPGPIYLRENPALPQSPGNECGAEAACTIAVSKEGEELSGTGESRFWAASREGTKAIFTSGEDLYKFEVEGEATTAIAHQVLGVAGIDEEADTVYFASKEVPAGVEPNPLGRLPLAGQRNLYRYRDGEIDFVATLGSRDLADYEFEPQHHPTRVSPNGEQLAFMSTARLTGYDNTDRRTGEADSEVFLYDAAANGGGGQLLCASCNPSGARPTGRFVAEKPFGGAAGFVYVASQIPVYENNLYASRVLSDDGRRLFFESSDALALRDTNGAIDVYQWEAPGAGGCKAGDSDYSPLNEGCIDLISSGKSPVASKFLDASPDGRDAFFSTASSLLPQDYGLIDVYDARVGGGLPSPASRPQGCEGDGCQSPAPAPDEPTAASASFRGQGNPRADGGPRCAKGRRQVRRNGKSRCARKKSAKAKRKRASHNARAGR